MMTVYFVVMTICSGMEGCVDERKPGEAYASKAECMESIGAMTRRKGVKLKCGSEPQWMLKEARRLESPNGLITTKAVTGN